MEQILSLRLAGFTFDEISKKTGCGRWIIRKILFENGLKDFQPNRMSLAKCFNKYVIKNDNGCWSWSGPVTNMGYGRFSLNGKRWLAHRVSYKIHHGDIYNFKVCHKCDNPICSNPDHLFLGTNKDNTVDMMLKGRHNKSILGPQDVIEIRKLLNKSSTGREIAKKYGVSDPTISHIKAGRTWKFV